MKKGTIFFLLLISSISLISCSNKENYKTYKSEVYGFYFTYPTTFKESDSEENKFAFLDKEKNAILFIINPQPQSQDIRTLGEQQAYLDLSGRLTNEEVKDQVQVMKMQERIWYTYAIDFPGEEIKSIISGTLCNDNEITIVLVTKNAFYEENKKEYLGILATFVCH